MELYKYTDNKPTYDLYIDKDHPYGSESVFDGLDMRKIVLEFASPVNTGSAINNTVYSELFINCSNEGILKDLLLNKKTEDLKDPLVVIVHGFATKEDRLKNYYRFIGELLRNGFSCLFVNLPFHLKRTPEDESSGQRIIYYDDKQTLEFFNQAVLDIRKAVNIVSLMLKPSNIDICGISLGSMIAVIAKAFEEKISKAVLVLSGGNWNLIHWNGFMRFVLKGNCVDGGKVTKEKCTYYYKDFYDFLLEFKKTDPDDIDSELKDHEGLKELCCKYCYLCDPVTFAYKIKKEDVLMINARFDHVFPSNSTKQLWEGLLKPQIHWLNYIHKTDILNKGKTLKYIIKFLKNC